METAGLLSPHVSDAAVLYPSSEIATMPASSLQTADAWQAWRATGTSVRLTWDLGDPALVDTGFMAGLRASPSARWRWLWAASLPQIYYAPNIALDWTVIDASGRIDWRLYPNRRSLARFPQVTASAIAVEIEDPANADPLEAWRLGFGRLFQPAGNIDQELSRPIEIADVQLPRFTGGRVTGARGRVKGFAARWSALTRAEADRLEEIGMLRGGAGDVLFILDPSNTARLQRDSVLGPLLPGYPDIVDVGMWPGDGDDQQMSRGDIRVIEGNS